MPKDNDSTFAGLSKKEGAIIIAVLSLAILAGTQIAINGKILWSVDFSENPELAAKIVDNNNTLFSQLVAASFVFLGIGGGVAATIMTTRSSQKTKTDEDRGPPKPE